MALVAPSTFEDNLRGSAFMLAGMFGFAVNDTISKAFSGEMAVGQFMFVRGLIATSMVFVVATAMGQMRAPSAALHPLLLLRGMGEALAAIVFLIALWQIPFANVAAVMQALPLALTLAAALLFGEPIGWRRIAAVLAGMTGVLIILRPGADGYNLYSFLLILCVAFCVVRDLATRRLAGRYPPFFVTFMTALLVTLTGAAMVPFETWQPITARHLLELVASSLFLIVGYVCTVRAMEIGDVGFVAPFRYSVLLFSIAGGAMAYGEIPDPTTLLGASIVVAARAYAFHRERLRARLARVQDLGRR